jgi:hypothetical protein
VLGHVQGEAGQVVGLDGTLPAEQVAEDVADRRVSIRP